MTQETTVAGPEVRLDRLRPAEVRAAMARAPIAWVPLGALEYHAEHLPTGVDGITAQGLVERSARLIGGVVLPWSYMTMGTLRLPWSFRYDPGLVEATLRATLEQLPVHGVRLAIVHTGHAPMDLIHLVKRVCAEAEASSGGALRAYGLCYLELNAALGVGLGTGWPVAIDHASTIETSWVLGLEPDLVAVDRLPVPPDAEIPGIYGPNPRSTASARDGKAQLEAAASLLASRASSLLEGAPLDSFADLRSFVAGYWPEPMELRARAGQPGVGAILIRNPGAVSRYLTHLRLHLDGAAIEPAGLALVNPTAGEAPHPLPVATLGPESGFYVRRHQVAELRLADGLIAGRHRIDLDVGLGGVADRRFVADVEAT